MPAPVIAAIIMAGASTAGAAYSASKSKQAAKIQADSANHGADLQAEASRYAADTQSKASADALAYTKQEAERAAAQHESAQRGNYDQWAYRQAGIGSLGESIGLPSRQLPQYVPSNFGQAASGGQQGGGAPSAASAFLGGLLNSGTDPQAAIEQTNAKFGLTPEKANSAKYYGPEAHGGIPTIGLPDSYFALTDGKWNLTQRGGGGAAQSSSQPAIHSLGASASGANLPFVQPQVAPLVRPGTFLDYVNGRYTPNVQ